MAWTSPKTWATGEIVTAAKLNEQLRDNLLYLGDPPLNIDAGLLYTDTVNDRVGIGTTSPDKELEVVGAVKISGGYPILWFENTDWPGTVRFIHYKTGSLRLYDDVNSRMRARFEANGNVIFCEVAGKVGIATTSPEQKLDVAGTVQLRRVANADATNTLRDSSILQFQGAFWDGTASIKQEMYLKLDVYDEMTNAYRLTLFDTGGGWRAAFDVWGNDTILKVHSWLDGHSKIAFWEANSQKYNLGYDAVFDRWELYSATAGADIIRIPDAQLTVDGNSTFDDNAFDFHCQECDWSSAFEAKECPECGGKVEWLDDVALVVASTVANKVCELPKETLRKLEKLGIINTYGTLDRPGRPEIFLRLTQSYWFALSAIKQLYEKVKHLEAELEAHKAGAVI